MAILALMKLMLANAALALSISSYLVQAGMSNKFEFLCWLGTYGIFTYLDCIGVRQSAAAQFLATALCVLLLLFYSAASLTKFDSSNLFTSDGNPSKGGFLGFFTGLPFALQFFDGFEETPLLMEYAENPTVTIPKGVTASYVSVAIIAFLILIAGSGASDVDSLLNSEAPLMLGMM